MISIKNFLLTISTQLFLSFSSFALTDEAFKNTDKYQFLKISPIKKSKTFSLHAVFYPPEGKKLNHASYIKIWEKKNKSWNIVDELTPQSDLGLLQEYKLEKEVTTKDDLTTIAVEIEFIHCSLNGGQCAMERFLGKIPREAKSKGTSVNLTLRID
jgi:hypothetical protein